MHIWTIWRLLGNFHWIIYTRELLVLRTKYYEAFIKAMLQSIGVSIKKLKFVIGTSYQLWNCWIATFIGSCILSVRLLIRTIYVDCCFNINRCWCSIRWSGSAQDFYLCSFAEEYLPLLGYKKRAHLMNVTVGGLSGSKMSSSDPDSTIDLLDDAKSIKKAFCEKGNIVEKAIV